MKERPLSNADLLNGAIEKRAYELWEKDGGDQQTNWDKAEREIVKRGFQPKAVIVVEVYDRQKECLTTPVQVDNLEVEVLV